MKSARLRYLTAGESHGSTLVAILEGMPAGLIIDSKLIDRDLIRRQRGYGSGPRMKIEKDQAEILSGVMAGKTIGSPIAIQIHNKNHRQWKGKPIPAMTIPRPGHVDLNAAIKYGYQDLRPGLERASARETAARVAIGAICKQLLSVFEIVVGGYVTSIGKTTANVSQYLPKERFQRAEESDVRCPEEIAAKEMGETIKNAIATKNTLGGIIEIIVLGAPPGLGSHVHYDRKLDAKLGSAILSVQAIKGVEIGSAFHNATKFGTEAQDAIHLVNGRLVRPTNNAGGIEGGISTGQPIVIRAAMKPIATTLTPQQSVDLSSGMNVESKYERSDFCPVPRAVPILEAVTAFVLADVLLEKLGGDSMDEIMRRYETLRLANPADLNIEAVSHIWWPE